MLTNMKWSSIILNLNSSLNKADILQNFSVKTALEMSMSSGFDVEAALILPGHTA